MLDPFAPVKAAVLIALSCVLCAAVVAAETVPSITPPEEAAPLLQVPSPLGPLRYTPGRGLDLGRTGIKLGGYSNVDLVRNEGEPLELALDDLSFFIVWDPIPRVHLFSELEIERLLVIDTDGHGGTSEADFSAERLYGDFLASDRLGVRLGKFLTPVGRWNVIHAQPLVWTTSRPLVTIQPFDVQTTGAMIFGSVPASSGELSYSAYGQFVDQLDPEPETEGLVADRSAGARLEYEPRPELSVGSSFYAFERDGRWEQLVGLDTLWWKGPLELMGEFAFENATARVGDQWGLYLQAVLEVLSGVHLVGRYEHFDQRAPDPEVNLVVLGLAYKPRPYVVLKLEYLIADHRAEESPPGVKSSFALLF